MTKGVGTELVGGDREVAQGRVRKDPKERERCDRLDGAGPPEEGRFRKRSRPRRSGCRVSKGARDHIAEDWGHALCLVGR